MSAATAERHVRVTLEGVAHPVLDSHGKPTRALRLRYLAAGGQPATVLLLTDSDQVTVEDVDPPRAWTDGDVVQVTTFTTQTTYMRENGAWLSVPYGPASADAAVSAALQDTDVDAEVLRYQAGDQ